MLDCSRSLRGETVGIGVKTQVLMHVRTRRSLEDDWSFRAQVLMGNRAIGTHWPMPGRLSENRCVLVAMQTNKGYRRV
jgi:hypothetical protein